MLVFKLNSKIRIISLLFNIKLIYLSKYLICNNMKNENYIIVNIVNIVKIKDIFQNSI